MRHFEPDVTSRDVCSSFANVAVALKPTSTGFRKGNEVLRLTTVPTYAPGASTRRNAKDLIQLIYLPPN